MSLFLGKVHYLLFNKILWFQDLEDEIVEFAKNENLNVKEISDRVNVSYGNKITNRNLEEIIDTENIHQWLQNRINASEGRLACWIKEILINCNNSFEKLELIFKGKGINDGKIILSTKDIKNAKDIYIAMNDFILDGMPCDKVNSILILEDDLIQWKRAFCSHENIWSKENIDVDVFYNFRKLWVESFVNEVNNNYEYFENYDIFEIKKKKIANKNAIESMKEEHDNIKIMLKIIRKICYELLEKNLINFKDFNLALDFIVNYADAHHHQKEELILFKEMTSNLGELAETIIKNGMLVEHDFGRLYIRDLKIAIDNFRTGNNEAKLDIIANAISYTHLLERHIDKEDKVIYSYAERELSENIILKIDKDCCEYEILYSNEKIRCLNILNTLENKYLKEEK